MNIRTALAFCTLFAVIFAAQNLLSASPELTGKVVRVYDGDTLEVEHIGTVRLLGIDTPEWKASERDRYLLRQGVSESTLRRIASESRQRVRRIALGKEIGLLTDRDDRDRYGRLLAYVYLPDGRLLNQLLLEEGLAIVYRRFDFDLKADFLKTEKLARKTFRGIWLDLKE